MITIPIPDISGWTASSIISGCVILFLCRRHIKNGIVGLWSGFRFLMKIAKHNISEEWKDLACAGLVAFFLFSLLSIFQPDETETQQVLLGVKIAVGVCFGLVAIAVTFVPDSE